ncbi:MAG: nucleoside-diphosphate kinase [Jatrophihabitantaceae bacterium]
MHPAIGISVTAPDLKVIGPEHGAAIPSWLSAMPDKRALFAADTYFRECWEDLLEAFVEPEHELPELATITFKPDAFAGQVVEPALRWLVAKGFRVVAARQVMFDRLTIRGIWYYQWNIASRDRKDVVDELLGAGPSLLVALQLPGRPDATRHLSRIKGPAVPAHRRRGQLRHALASPNTLLNFVHTADEPADLVRELGVFFPSNCRRELLAELAAADDRLAQARVLAAQLQALTPPAELRFDQVLQSLCERLTPSAPGSAELLAERSSAARGGRPDWGRLLCRLERAGIPVTKWQRLVLATALIEMDVPTGEVLIRGVSSGGAAREHP